MRIFKRQWGQGKASSCWYCEFKDNSGILRTVKLFSDKRASEQAGASLEKLVAFRQARRALDADLLAFAESMPTTLREKLASWGLLGACRDTQEVAYEGCVG